MQSLSYEKIDHPDVSQVIFHPRKESVLPPSDASGHMIPIEDSISIDSRFYLAKPDEPHILFFHGNGEIASDYDDIGPRYVNLGLSLLAVDYRGYGNSDGTPSASTMMSDAHAIFQYIKGWLDREKRTGPLFVMGRSLGSASAIEIASSFKDEISGLILESAFAETLPMLITLGINIQELNISEKDGFNNVQKIEMVTMPVFMLHAQKDQLLPIVNAELLHSHCEARSKELSIVPGADHNTIISIAGDLYFTVLKQFTNKVLKVNQRKRRR